MVVTVVKDGKRNKGQGVAYLDDGTMIVVEGGHKHLNETLESCCYFCITDSSRTHDFLPKPK